MVKVGDIVKTKAKEGNRILPAVVTKVNMAGGHMHGGGKADSVEVLFADGTYGYRAAGRFTETGRHTDMQAVLDSIR